jgi:hypothetical protein
MPSDPQPDWSVGTYGWARLCSLSRARMNGPARLLLARELPEPAHVNPSSSSNPAPLSSRPQALEGRCQSLHAFIPLHKHEEVDLLVLVQPASLCDVKEARELFLKTTLKPFLHSSHCNNEHEQVGASCSS